MRDLWQASLQLFFQLLYNKFAWSYDLVAWLASRGQWKAWGQTALSHVYGERVLEVGHGPGHLLVALAERDLLTAGLDLSPTMVRQAKRRLQAADVPAPLVRARAQALPFHAGSVDTVVATFPTDYIVQSQTLREARRVLRPEGRLVVAVAARFEGEDVMSRFLAWLYHITGQDQPSPDAVIPWLEQAGLSARVTWEAVDRTDIMLIVAEKA
jgi:ubiquinone/menaquinone biosynthesis C-methylase UbiE